MMQKILNQDLDRKSIKEFKDSEKAPFIIVLDNVRSALNVGSIFRTADAFLIEAVFLCGITATPPNREILKTALGGTETVAWTYFDTTLQALETLKKNGWITVAVEQTTYAIPLQQYQPGRSDKTALIFGHEVNGVDQSVINSCNACIEIPQWGTKHSLNVTVAAGIVLWELYRKKVLSGV